MKLGNIIQELVRFHGLMMKANGNIELFKYGELEYHKKIKELNELGEKWSQQSQQPSSLLTSLLGGVLNGGSSKTTPLGEKSSNGGNGSSSATLDPLQLLLHYCQSELGTQAVTDLDCKHVTDLVVLASRRYERQCILDHFRSEHSDKPMYLTLFEETLKRLKE